MKIAQFFVFTTEAPLPSVSARQKPEAQAGAGAGVAVGEGIHQGQATQAVSH